MVRAIDPHDVRASTHAFEVETRQLRVKAGRHLAVNGLDLALGTGVHGLLGPNGAGKTTLMRALATVVKPTGGALRLLGQDATPGRGLRDVRGRLGYLPQQFGFYPRFTVRDYVEYMAWLRDMPSAAVPGAAQRAIERVHLADRADSRLKSLSGGMLRRAGIAQAIVNEPALLLLDEPTVGLDPEQRVEFRELVRELGATSCVVVSTHLVEDVVAACSDVLLLDHGTLVFQGVPADLARFGAAGGVGDSPAERGYSHLLRQRRSAS
ncbi:ATP-binding cassette domain-containing protein [Micromonospora sp. WMMD1102]|uniref:ATP-binding cassette domain-containing protein n=1 Tax=Micromonospora sp. WMMD1102 TaxID=3016105 RepID=UPI0024150A56|nr:ATP-binding cassette domain-containing protein [Micromonospora sp. WMMD1102]MDG4788866.1 ATP-binding cassette domain-containing protein [Micromonospora sp. WMMD1102]